MNSKTFIPDLSRRKFLGACCASVGATGLLSALAQLRLMGAVADTDASSTPPRAGAPAADYKALVCLFLAGGNDANNLVVPTDATTYADYATGRGVIALGQNVSQYAVGTGGAIALMGNGTGTSVNGLRTSALNDALAMQNANLFETAFGGFTAGAINNSALLSTVITGASPVQAIFNAAP